MKKFIQDYERVLDANNDLLQTSVYAEDLVQVIENTPTDKVFTIGVFGGWGTGKSSIIKTAQSRLEDKHESYKFITYDAWKYANDSFRRMFLLKIQEELRLQPTGEMNRFYRSENAEAEPKTKLSGKGLAIAAGVILILSLLLFFIPGVEFEWRVAVPTIGTLGTFFIALLNGCFYDLKISFSKPALFAPEQFESCFKEMMKLCLKKQTWFQSRLRDIKEFVNTGEKSIKNLEKLMIVIDNIDRCSSDIAYQLLTDIKTFLSNEDYNVVFIVPVDDEALKKHLFRKWNNGSAVDSDVNKEKEEFLRKFFNITLRIKPHQETELRHFAHEINNEYQLGYNNDTLAIVSKVFADNPRRIIQLLNNLSGEIILYSEEFAKEYETAICAALILRETYPVFYKKAASNLERIRNFNPMYAEKDNESNSSNSEESLPAFMRISNVIFKRTPHQALQRIFTNTSSIFSILPEGIRQLVRSFDAPAIIKFAKDNEGLQTNLVEYIMEEVRTDVKYGATSQTTRWIDFLSLLYKNSVFDRSQFGTIDNLLSNYYSTAIPEIDEPYSLFNLGAAMRATGFDGLRNSIIDYINNGKDVNNTHYNNILSAYLTYFVSEDDCQSIANKVEEHYVNYTIDQTIDYTPTQITLLFGDSFVKKQIDSLPALDQVENINDIIWCLKQNKALSKDTYASLFNKYKELFGDTRGREKDDFLLFISQVQASLDAIETKSLSKEPEIVYQMVTSGRRMPNPTHPQPQYDTSRNLLDEVNNDEAKVVAAFCFEIMRITGGQIDIHKAIETLYDKCSNTIISSALEINSLGVSIAPLAPTLVQADDYESKDVLTMLGIILSRQPDGTMMLNNDSLEKKIKELIDNSTIKGVEHLLSDLVKDDQIKVLVTDYIATLNSTTINSLPISVSKYAVSSFIKENAADYKNNPDFLILVLNAGSAAQKKEVVNLMKQKLVSEVDLEDVLNVLNHLKTDNQALLRSVVGELENVKSSDTVDDSLKPQIANLIEKLSVSIKPEKKKKRKLFSR